MKDDISLLSCYFMTPPGYFIEARNFKAIQNLIGNHAVVSYQRLDSLIEISRHNPDSYATSMLMSVLYQAISAKRIDLIEFLLPNIPKQFIVQNSILLLNIFYAQPRFSNDFYNHTQSNYFILEKIIKLLLNNGLDITAISTNTGSNILHVFSEFGISGEDYELNNQIDVNKTDYFGQTPLIKAAETSNFEIMKYLIRQGANVKLKDSGYNTALHLAVINRAHQAKSTAKIIALLLDKGADPYAKDSRNTTPLDYLLQGYFSKESFLAFYMHGIKFDFTNETLRYKLAKKVKYFKIKTPNKTDLMERLLFKLIFLKEFSEEDQPKNVKDAKINIINELTNELAKVLDKLPNRKLLRSSTLSSEHLNLLNQLRKVNNISSFLKEVYKQILQENIDNFSDLIKELYGKLLNFIDNIFPKIKNNLNKIEKKATDALNYELQQEDNIINSKNLLTKLVPFGRPMDNIITFFKGEDIENLLSTIKHPQGLEKVKLYTEQNNKRIRLSEDNKAKEICMGSNCNYARPLSEIQEPTNASNDVNLEVVGSNKYSSHLDSPSFFNF